MEDLFVVKDLGFEIIKNCHDNCFICAPNSSVSCSDVVDIALFKKTIDYLSEKYHIEQISLFGGEPFLHPDLVEMVEYCKSKSIRTVIFTSGITHGHFLSREEREIAEAELENSLKEIEENEPENQKLQESIKKYYANLLKPHMIIPIQSSVLHLLKEKGLDQIIFDWRVLDKETSNEIMDIKDIISNLLQSIIRTSQMKLNFDVNFTPNASNYREFPNLLECLNIVGVKKICVLNFDNQSSEGNPSNTKMTSLQMEEFSNIYKKCKKKYKGSLKIEMTALEDCQSKSNPEFAQLLIKYDDVVLGHSSSKERQLVLK